MKSVLLFLLGALVGGLAVSFVAVSRVEVVPVSPEPVATTTDAPGAVRYNCELSGGIVENGSCVCPLELNQTQEMMYDASKGFCQTTFGGPGGDAFRASVGLPRGHYGFWNDIVFGLCEESGGSVSGAACICREGDLYDPARGRCVAASDVDCSYGKRYGLFADETYNDGCNSHTCQDDGSVISTERACE